MNRGIGSANFVTRSQIALGVNDFLSRPAGPLPGPTYVSILWFRCWALRLCDQLNSWCPASEGGSAQRERRRRPSARSPPLAATCHAFAVRAVVQARGCTDGASRAPGHCAYYGADCGAHQSLGRHRPGPGHSCCIAGHSSGHIAVRRRVVWSIGRSPSDA
jgi:hypothetical protein